MTLLESLVSRPSVLGALQHLCATPDVMYARTELESLLFDKGLTNPTPVVDELMDDALLARYGPRIGLSHSGQRVGILLWALEGGDVEEAFRKLRRLDGHLDTYQLVQEGMTSAFFRSFIDRPTFQRIFVCSPWINPTIRDGAILRWAVMQAMKRGESPEVLVLSRPRSMMPPGSVSGLPVFEEVGAKIWYNRRLHSKLYIKEPDRRGGAPLAVVGSQNLTRATNVELGIRINGDSALIDQLIRYFWQLTSRSKDTDTSEGEDDGTEAE